MQPAFLLGRFFYRNYLECEELARDGFGISLTPDEYFRMDIIEHSILSSKIRWGDEMEALESLCKLFGITQAEIEKATALGIWVANVNVPIDT